MGESQHSTSDAQPSEDLIFRLLTRIAAALEVSVDQSDIIHNSDQDLTRDPLRWLVNSAEVAGIFMKEVKVEDIDDVGSFVLEGYPIVAAMPDGKFIVVDSVTGRSFDTTWVGEHVNVHVLSRAKLRRVLFSDPAIRLLVAKKELDCEPLSSRVKHELGYHVPPLRRFLALLNLERRDISLVFLFSFVAGVLTLATPLAVESMVNVVSWGIYLQPLIVLGLMLLVCLGLAGVLSLLQTVVVEMIQRRQLVRMVSDFAHRFPRVQQAALAGEYPRELANRVFDIMTIQKATSVLLLDGVNLVLTTMLGMILLAFYHPFLLGFDVVLLFSMISITWLLGRGGIRTAIDESVAKYQIVHWLQDVLSQPTVFKTGGGESLAINRANQLTATYLHARGRQFQVVLRQTAFAISLQVIASTVVLALGGWLVIVGELTLGQLVASELVVTVVVGAFAKAGKSLEKYYDLMAGMDKVGHLIDLPTDPRHELGAFPFGPVDVRWSDLVFERATSTSKVEAALITAGSTAAIIGDDREGRSDLAKTLAGIITPTAGLAQVGDLTPENAASGRSRLVGYAGVKEVFHGTIRENIDLGRPGIGADRVREVLTQVGLFDAILKLPESFQTKLQTGGYPLSSGHVAKLVIARAMAANPKVLVIDGLLDELGTEVQDTLWSVLTAKNAPWTLIVVTNRADIAGACDSQIAVRRLAPAWSLNEQKEG